MHSALHFCLQASSAPLIMQTLLTLQWAIIYTSP